MTHYVNLRSTRAKLERLLDEFAFATLGEVSSMSSPELVREYFEREAQRFDAIYEERKPIHQRAVERYLAGWWSSASG